MGGSVVGLFQPPDDQTIFLKLMSKQELLELVAPLSPEERRQLRELLDEEFAQLAQPLSPEEVEEHPMMRVVRDLERMPPMDAPTDFSVNHDFYIRGGTKREP